MTDGDSAFRCAKNLQRQRTESSKSYTLIDVEKEYGPVVNVDTATILDVPGIELQVPLLSSPVYSVWILMSRDHERFVNEIHRHNTDIVNYGSSLLMCVHPRRLVPPQFCAIVNSLHLPAPKTPMRCDVVVS